MRIGLISDTHVPEAGERLPGEVFDLLAGVDMVMHAGDMHIIDVLDWLEVIAPVGGAGKCGDGFRPPFPDNDPRVEHAQVLDRQSGEPCPAAQYPPMSRGVVGQPCPAILTIEAGEASTEIFSLRSLAY